MLAQMVSRDVVGLGASVASNIDHISMSRPCASRRRRAISPTERPRDACGQDRFDAIRTLASLNVRGAASFPAWLVLLVKTLDNWSNVSAPGKISELEVHPVALKPLLQLADIRLLHWRRSGVRGRGPAAAS